MKPLPPAYGWIDETEALCMQCTPDREFRLSIFSADPGHHSGSGLLVDDVRHLPPGLASETWYTAVTLNSRGF